MQTFTSTVRCAVCKRLLAKAVAIPQADCAQAAEAATRVLACPERGHMRNSSLIFDWFPEPTSPTAAPPAAPQGNAPSEAAAVIEAPPAPRSEILTEDELSALIAEHEGREAQPEVGTAEEGSQEDDGPITLNGSSEPDDRSEPDLIDTADLAARVLSGEI